MGTALLDLKSVWDTPGEHSGLLSGVAGAIEACLTIPEEKHG